MTQYWLMKSEPDTFSIDDLKNCPNKTDCWSGVRNFQARNMMKNDMKLKDQIFFYHSSCKPPGIVGLAEVVRTSYPDPTQFDPKSKYYDPRATKEKPYWYLVDVKFKKKFSQMVTLEDLRNNKDLKDMPLMRQGNRLSIMPVTAKEWESVMEML